MAKLGVHSGVFHADDVFSVALMQGIIDGLEVIRTRDSALLATCDIVADVGDGKYDHHQADKVLREDGIPYCAFGLLWKDFGIAYLNKNFKELEDVEQQKEVVGKIAYDFISQIDAGDNGVDVNTYNIPVTTISQVINSFMPFNGTKEEVEEGFREAVAFAHQFFYKLVRKYVESYYNINYIKTLLEEQPIKETRILVLERAVGWKEAVLQMDKEAHLLFVVFEDLSGSWRVQTVPKEAHSFEARADLPKVWSGLRDKEMDKVTGVEGCIFCHPSLFICGHETKEGALKLAQLAVKEVEDNTSIG